MHGGSSICNRECWNLQTVSQPQSLPEKKKTAATAQSLEPEGTELLSPSLVVFTGEENRKKKTKGGPAAAHIVDAAVAGRCGLPSPSPLFHRRAVVAASQSGYLPAVAAEEEDRDLG